MCIVLAVYYDTIWQGNLIPWILLCVCMMFLEGDVFRF